jgi:aspartate carbamoyltransferase catalytic subunit
MIFKKSHVLSTEQFDRKDLDILFEETLKMEKILADGGQCDLLEGKILATLFYEPSTRTRFSFETAMLRLGGRVISNADMMQTSSVKKQETLEDTGKVVSQMADIIVMRHPEAGSVKNLAGKSDVPVINAGDGPNQHPTQALLDVYTIWKDKGKIDGLTVGMIGDLKYGRVPHSQCDLLKHYNVDFVFVSPRELRMPNEIIEDLRKINRSVAEMTSFNEAISQMDVIAMTRIQEERFESKAEYLKYKGTYVLDEEVLGNAKEDAIIIHPLPRVDEISPNVDTDSRAKYFEQVKNGVALRMALFNLVLK